MSWFTSEVHSLNPGPDPIWVRWELTGAQPFIVQNLDQLVCSGFLKRLVI